MKKANSQQFKYISPTQISDGSTLLHLRPIEPNDAKQALSFRDKLSDESIKDRFLGYIPTPTQDLIHRLTQVDTSKEQAIVAEIQNSKHNDIIAIARIAKDEDKAADFAIIIGDDWQGKGLGILMTEYMIQLAKQMGFEKIHALVYSTNLNMLDILKEFGFHLKVEDNTTTYAELSLI
ncbi:MAG: GNAT family N-acetyltransferase [Chitinophagales bacterium]